MSLKSVIKFVYVLTLKNPMPCGARGHASSVGHCTALACLGRTSLPFVSGLLSLLHILHLHFICDIIPFISFLIISLLSSALCENSAFHIMIWMSIFSAFVTNATLSSTGLFFNFLKFFSGLLNFLPNYLLVGKILRFPTSLPHTPILEHEYHYFVISFIEVKLTCSDMHA